MTRRLRGLAALVALVALLVGVPVLLGVLTGNPLSRLATPRDLVGSLLRPDGGGVLVVLLSLVAWVAWLVFAVSVLAEVLALAARRGRPPRRVVLPGLGGVQQVAAGLVLGAFALLATSQLAGPGGGAVAAPLAEGPLPGTGLAPADQPSALAARAAPSPVSVVEAPAAPASAAAAAGPAHVHVVEPGDDLWSLAEHYYGQGRDWRRIAAANPGVLTGGPDRLEVGWRLVVPDVAAPEGPDRVRVRAGDSLSTIAERTLGDEDRWPALYRANRDQLTDPDEVPAGISLRLPAAPRHAEPPSTGSADEGSGNEGSAGAAHEPDIDDGTGGTQDPGDGAGPRSSPTPAPTPTSPANGGAPSGPVPPATADPVPTTEPVPPPAPTTLAAPTATAAPPATAAPTAPTAPAAPTAGASAPTAPTSAPLPPATDPAPSPEERDLPAVPLGLVAVGGLLAAGLVGGLAARRRLQLQVRPPGRRIVHPPPVLRPAEVELGRRAQPVSLRTLDRATRAVAAHCRSTGAALPSLELALVGPDGLELVFAAPAPDAPVCFDVAGDTWRLAPEDAGYLGSVPGMSDALRPWPALVSLGRDGQGREVLADLEAFGLLGLHGPDEAAVAVLAAMAAQLSFSPWTEELTLTLVGGDDRLPEALGRHEVTRCADPDVLLDRLERRAAEQRAHASERPLAEHRLDVDLADPWVPEVVLVGRALEPGQLERLVRLVTARPRVPVAAVVCGDTAPARWTLELDGGDAGVLLPRRTDLVVQALPAPARDAVVGLVAATGSEATTPAPWGPAAEDPPPGRPPDNVTSLGSRLAGGAHDADGDDEERRAAVRARMGEAPDVAHPTLQLLGPVTLLGAAGTPPPRAARQCLEYCAWLLEHPGSTAQAMANGLVVAEGTRRSNMSRLRTWLGADATGRPYLPDAYTGRIRLDDAVASDWDSLRLLTTAGVARASSANLELALELVRGAPLADAAPSQWCWAEELRTDLISCVRDVGVELAARAVAAGDVDLARWAAARALVAAPGDELLLAARVRTEHLAGNVAETERLSRQLAQQARVLGVDLEPSTVALLQQVVEGRIRARLA